jgi:hypothetical protein
MARRLEHVESAADECRKWAASFDYQVKSSLIVGIVGYNGQTRKLFMSVTPSDWRVHHKIRKNVREYIREMSNKDGK